MLHCVDIANFAEVGDQFAFQRYCIHLAEFEVGAGVDAHSFGEVASTDQTKMFHCVDQTTHFEVDRGIVLRRCVHLADFGDDACNFDEWASC